MALDTNTDTTVNEQLQELARKKHNDISSLRRAVRELLRPYRHVQVSTLDTEGGRPVLRFSINGEAQVPITMQPLRFTGW